MSLDLHRLSISVIAWEPGINRQRFAELSPAAWSLRCRDRVSRGRANYPRDKRRTALRECGTRLSLPASHAPRGDVAKNLSMTADEYDAVPSGISFVPFDLVIGH
jgi:hypothetical protein